MSSGRLRLKCDGTRTETETSAHGIQTPWVHPKRKNTTGKKFSFCSLQTVPHLCLEQDQSSPPISVRFYLILSFN
jgi:hypothetical protein